MSNAKPIEPTDDRGQAVSLHALDLPDKPPKHLRKLSEKIALDYSKDLHWTWVLGYFAMGFGPLLFLILWGHATQQTSPANWQVYLAIACFAVVTFVAFRWVPLFANSRARETNRRATNAWTEAGLCPACGHDLALDLHTGDAKPEDDGIAPCPACHAQWHAARFRAAIEAHAGDWRRQWKESRAGSPQNSTG